MEQHAFQQYLEMLNLQPKANVHHDVQQNRPLSTSEWPTEDRASRALCPYYRSPAKFRFFFCRDVAFAVCLLSEPRNETLGNMKITTRDRAHRVRSCMKGVFDSLNQNYCDNLLAQFTTGEQSLARMLKPPVCPLISLQSRASRE